MAKLISILTDQVEKQLDQVQEQMTEQFLEEQYAPHYKYKIEERKATRSVHLDRKRSDFDKSNLHKVRKIKRQQKWIGVD
jgi:hypothetical protein